MPEDICLLAPDAAHTIVKVWLKRRYKNEWSDKRNLWSYRNANVYSALSIQLLILSAKSCSVHMASMLNAS